MGVKHNSKRLLVAAVTIAGLAGGSMAVQADTFSQRATTSQDLALVSPPTWPAVASTCLVDCEIWLTAGPGVAPVQDAVDLNVNVPFLGFGVTTSVGDAPVFALAGAPSSIIKVPVGTTLTINFSQVGISDPIDLSFPSLAAADVSHVGSVYTVEANTVGTSVFQPGSNPQAPRQVAMGLVGVLIVTPQSSGAVDCSSCAYDGDAPYADEAVVATTDLDLEFALSPSTFDMSYFGQSRTTEDTRRRVYHVINGKSFPDTDVIDARAGDNVLLRYVNAGVTDKSMGLLGLHQSVLARNTSTYVDPQSVVAPLIGPGETADVAVAIPADTLAGQKYSLMDQSREMNHGNASGFGGALTFLNVWAGNLPTISAVAYDPSTHTVTATGTPSSLLNTLTSFQTLVTPTATAPAEVDWTTAVDTFAPLGAGNPAPIIKILSPAPPIGSYVWVRVQQSGAVSAPGSALVTPMAPTVSSVGLNGGILTANGASDPTLNIDAFQVFVNTGVPPVVGDWVIPPVESVAIPAPLVSINRPISANGGDTIWVRVRDSLGGWSNPGSVVVPTPEVQLATFVAPDGLTIVAISGISTANITAAEWSLGLAAAPAGTGFGVISSLFGNSAYSESITIPAPTAPNTIWVRVQDSNGTWSDALGVPVV